MNKPYFTLVDPCTFKAGKYWIGDIGYLIPKDKWDDYCKIFSENYVNCGKFIYFVTGTADGDGTYYLYKNGDRQEGELGVDGGTLSIIPFGLVKKWRVDSKRISWGITIDVERDFTVDFGGGNFEFGDYKVITDGSDDDDDDYCECCGRGDHY